MTDFKIKKKERISKRMEKLSKRAKELDDVKIDGMTVKKDSECADYTRLSASDKHDTSERNRTVSKLVVSYFTLPFIQLLH